MTKREEYINQALYNFRGGLAREFYFDNEEMPSIPYYYDAHDDCLHADAVFIPFHHKEEDITDALIFKSLCDLEKLLKEYFETQFGITLYEYD